MPRGHYVHARVALEIRFWAKVHKTDSCWLWTGGKLERGYGVIRAAGQGSGIYLAHRLAYEWHYGPIPHGLLVCHSCDNPSCVNPEHLFLGSNADNHWDMIRKKRTGLTRLAKLTDEQVADIRLRYRQGGTSYSRLAKEYGVSKGNINDVVVERRRA